MSRIPVEIPSPIPHAARSIQVNHCRMPDCGNYGVPASTKRVKSGPSADRDPHYTVQSTNKGRVPCLKCKCCGEKPPIKSNLGIAEELARLAKSLKAPEDFGCKKEDCINHEKSVAEYPECYKPKGFRADTGEPIKRCTACGTKFTVGDEPPRIHHKNRHLAVEIYSRVVNKSPVKRTLRGVNLTTPSIYYKTVRFIQRRCNRLSGGMERGMLRGQVPLPESLHLVSDMQLYQLNWTDRLDKRNPMFSAICTVDRDSRYVFGLHANYDPDADAFAIAQDAARRGDFDKAEPHRRYARLWLPGDELLGGRAAGERLGIDRVREIRRQLAEIYVSAESRADVEDRELAELHPGLHNVHAGTGMQVHIPYTVYAHFFLMRELMLRGGVKQVQYSMDCESLLRAAFLSAWQPEVGAGTAHGFYVRHHKYQTVPEREAAKLAAKKVLGEFMQQSGIDDRREAAWLLLTQRLEAAAAYGKWQDRWAEHPIPTMNEPYKAVCWLTQRPESNPTPMAVAEMALDAGLGPVDNVFQVTRRWMNALERPIGTSSGYNRVWHGYAPYNPAMLQQYLDLFRCTWNYCNIGKDGNTPAMRLGLTTQSLSYNDVLWPGEAPPVAPVKEEAAGLDPLAQWDARQANRLPEPADDESPPDEPVPIIPQPGM